MKLSLQDRNMQLKKLKAIKKRADEGIQTRQDYIDTVDILLKLVKLTEIKE
ncbi:hypothetical protein ACDN41_12195 [Priestia aryabhattai]|uniref:hypothetical protein n=1 Tax=Priestia aryabhattai TaxID=412384 RepID=UPI00353270EB